MDTGKLALDLDLEGFSHLNAELGLFQTLSLYTKYNYNWSDFSGGVDYRSGSIKTWLHETLHLCQTLGTPYGYYHYSLRRLQTNEILAIMHLLRKHGLSHRISFPMIEQIQSLNRLKYPDIMLHLWYWFACEVILLYLDGSFDELSRIYSSRVRSTGNPARLPISILFSVVEQLLAGFLANHQALIGYSESKKPEKANFNDDLRMLALKSAGLDVINILESWARVSEEWIDTIVVKDKPSVRATVCATVSRLMEQYHLLPKLKGDYLNYRNSREFILAYSAVCDLCLCGPILPQHAKLRPPNGIRSISPIFRFLDAMTVARKLPPLVSLPDQYGSFVQELCGTLGWPTPSKIAHRTVATMAADVPEQGAKLFRRAQELRTNIPWILLDMDLWNREDQIGTEFTAIFTPSVVEFRDRTLYHSDRTTMDHFLVTYTMNKFLRSYLVSKEPPVVHLPFRTQPHQLKFYAELVAGHILNATGTHFPVIALTSSNDRLFA